MRVQLPRQWVQTDDPFGELRALAETAGAIVVGELSQKRNKPRGRTYLGKGKVEELANLVKMLEATVIVFDNDLSPAQIKSVEEETCCKVIDRSELILDIFANRATTHAAKLQVEIAQLEYTYPRLRAMWTHLGQITGGAPVGIGTRGPGEKQLEIDRRLVQRRLRQLRDELNGVLARKEREVAQRNTDHFTVGLVGYTNAGKSTLFNRLTSGGAFAHDQLFATLGTRIERWDLGGGDHAMLSDTVGFIRNLPHHLVASFRSTLEETIYAQAIVIVLDVADPHAAMQFDVVNRTLDEIGATSQPRMLVLNKVDALAHRDEVFVWLNRVPEALPVSAKTGEGLEELGDVVRTLMLGGIEAVRLEAPLADGRAVDFIEKRTPVETREYNGAIVAFDTHIGRRHVEQLLALGSDIRVNGLPGREALREIWGVGADDDGFSTPKRIAPHTWYYAQTAASHAGDGPPEGVAPLPSDDWFDDDDDDDDDDRDD